MKFSEFRVPQKGDFVFNEKIISLQKNKMDNKPNPYPVELITWLSEFPPVYFEHFRR